MTTPPKSKRIYLINREFQLRYVRLGVLIGLGSTILTSVVILYPLFQFQILRFPNFVPAPFMWSMLFAAVLNLLTIAAFGVVVTHRIAGPMFSLVRHFRTLMQTGRLKPELRVRDTDDMKFVVRNFNEFVAHFRGMVESDVARLQQVKERLAAGEAAEAQELAANLAAEMSARLGDEGVKA